MNCHYKVGLKFLYIKLNLTGLTHKFRASDFVSSDSFGLGENRSKMMHIVKIISFVK